MTQESNKYPNRTETKQTKSVIFLFVVFPFISHIYGAFFPMIYSFDVSIIISVILFFSIISAVNENLRLIDKYSVYFIPFLLVSLAASLLDNNFIFAKYFAYFVVYFFFFRRFFLERFIFKLYVNIITVSFILLVIIYLLTIFTNVINLEDFLIPNLQYLSPNAPIQDEKWKYQIFYLLVYVPGDISGIFSFPRFYGFSREPGMFVAFILPGFLMAYYFRMKLQSFILGTAIIITSSFAGFVTVFVLLILAILPENFYKIKVPLLIVFLTLILIFIDEFSLLEYQRVDDYIKIINLYIYKYVDHITSFKIDGLIFLLGKLSYLIILYAYYKKTKLINNRIPFLFLVSFVFILNKANELISPLFLFYLLFIDYLYYSLVSKKELTTY